MTEENENQKVASGDWEFSILARDWQSATGHHGQSMSGRNWQSMSGTFGQATSGENGPRTGKGGVILISKWKDDRYKHNRK